MKSACLCVCVLLSYANIALPADEAESFHRALANASRMSSLALPGSAPFHMKISAKERYHDLSEFRAEIEVWWAAPDKWRREVHSATFSQTAVRRGELYSESNSADYLPFWLYELIQASVDPVPLSELTRDHVEWTKRGCAEWREAYPKENETAYVHHSICFAGDGTVRELFTPNTGILLGDYRDFAGKKVASTITTWPRGGAEIKGVVTELEMLKSDDSLFELSSDQLPYSARLRFVSAPEAALELDKENSAPLYWPVVHNFPASGVMAVNVKVDRQGAVREIGTIVSTNFVLTDTAREQIAKWRFKPYLVDGTPVQVNTTLAVHFDAKVEFLGKSGKSLPALPFLERMKLSRQISDPRSSDSAPFRMRATIEGRNGQKGTYEEIWSSPDTWEHTIHFGAAALHLASDRGKTSQKATGGRLDPSETNELLELLVTGHFPDRHYEVYEADWGQSVVTFAGADAVRVARGKVDANNEPISGQAYWFDAAGLLRGDYEGAATTIYSEFALWNDKQVPLRLEVAEKGVRKWLVLIDTLEPAQ